MIDINPSQTDPELRSTDSKESDSGVSLALQWIFTYQRYTRKLATLFLADSRLAVASGMQLLFLVLVGAFVVGCVWLILCVLSGWLLLDSGFSVTSILLVLFCAHLLLLILVAVAVKFTLAGVNFVATKELLAKTQAHTDEEQHA